MVASTQKTARYVQEIVSTTATIKALRSVAATAFAEAAASPQKGKRLESGGFVFVRCRRLAGKMHLTPAWPIAVM